MAHLKKTLSWSYKLSSSPLAVNSVFVIRFATHIICQSHWRAKLRRQRAKVGHARTAAYACCKVSSAPQTKIAFSIHLQKLGKSKVLNQGERETRERDAQNKELKRAKERKDRHGDSSTNWILDQIIKLNMSFCTLRLSHFVLFSIVLQSHLTKKDKNVSWQCAFGHRETFSLVTFHFAHRHVHTMKHTYANIQRSTNKLALCHGETGNIGSTTEQRGQVIHLQHRLLASFCYFPLSIFSLTQWAEHCTSADLNT